MDARLQERIEQHFHITGYQTRGTAKWTILPFQHIVLKVDSGKNNFYTIKVHPRVQGLEDSTLMVRTVREDRMIEFIERLLAYTADDYWNQVACPLDNDSVTYKDCLVCCQADNCYVFSMFQEGTE